MVRQILSIAPNGHCSPATIKVPRNTTMLMMLAAVYNDTKKFPVKRNTARKAAETLMLIACTLPSTASVSTSRMSQHVDECTAVPAEVGALAFCASICTFHASYTGLETTAASVDRMFILYLAEI